MRRIAINGRFLARRQTGQERFAGETLRYLDGLAEPGQYVLVVPKEYAKEISLQNIEVVRYGGMRSHAWEQTNFAWYVFHHRMLSLNLCTIHPLFSPGVVCIHDICYKTNPQFFPTLYGRLSTLWHRAHYWLAAKRAQAILTVTNTSKEEIGRVYGVEADRITVIPNGWEHIERIAPEDGVQARFPELRMDEYFLSIGSLMPHKNQKWVFGAAKANPGKQFVIVGRTSLSEYGDMFGEKAPDNVITTGYLSDGELKFLLMRCRALIFPSLYEGFGIPPLEALALNREAIVANASCMPEIYGPTVHYLDPHDPDVDIDELLSTPVEPPDKVLEKYRYENAARVIHDLLLAL